MRTDATTEYFAWINSHWIVYNPVTNHFFIADPYSNHLMVLDAASETEIATISVPGAFSIDDTPDHKTLYVGTLIGDVYTVDPVAMAVTKRYIGSQIGPSGYLALSALVLADGRLALLGSNNGFPVDGSPNYAIWDPVNNSFALGSCSSFIGNIGGILRTSDRTKIILTSVDSGPFCEVDESTGESSTFGPGGFPSVNARITPDGHYLVTPFNTETLPPNQYAYVYDLTTLNLVAQFPISGDTSTAGGFAISADSKTLFTPTDTIIYAYDLATGLQVGWLPNVYVPPTSGGGAWGPIDSANLQAVDGTGLLVGPLEEGIAFIDTTILRTGPVGTQFTNGYLNPATGPTAGGTQVQLGDPNPFGALSAMYFGSRPSTQLSGRSGIISATTPAGNAGPADVYTFTTDGGFQLVPEGFSYGPTILEVSPNLSTTEGGGTGYIFGYGFGPVSSSTAVPPGLQVTVGGTLVHIDALYSITGAVPFQLQVIAYTVPPGVIGSADIEVLSNSGNATARSTLTYPPPLQQFSLTGAALAQGIYDSYRDVYYFTDANKIQVFSKTERKWLSPISIPAPAAATQRLWGIAMSPDGSKLAVADAMAGVIYVLDPISPGSVKTFAVNKNNVGLVVPCGVAVSNAGMVYYAMSWQGISGASAFYKLNTSNGAITDYGFAATGSPSDIYLRTIISSDNSRVFFNDDGFVFYINTATDKWVPASVDQTCCYGDYELTLSPNQARFEASSYFYDSNLNAESYYSLNDREILTTAYVYGAKLSPDGRLLFQPSTNGIDILDGRLGNLLNRIALPMALSPNYDALVTDGKDDILLAITGSNGDGVAIVDLTSITEPAPLPYLSNLSSAADGLARRGSRSRFVSQAHRRPNTRAVPLPAAPRIIQHVTKPVLPGSAMHRPLAQRDRH